MNDSAFQQLKIAAYEEVIEHARRSYKNHGTKESTHRTALACLAIGIDEPWRAPTEFKHLNAVKQFGKACFDKTTTSEIPYDEAFPTGSYAGIIIDPVERHITLDETAVKALTIDGGNFPEVGIYVPYTTAARMVGMAIEQASDPDTIVGKVIMDRMQAGLGDGADATGEPENPSEASSAAQTTDTGASDDSDAGDSSDADDADDEDWNGEDDDDDTPDPVPLATNLEVHTKAELIDMYAPADVTAADTKANIIAAIIAQWPLPKLVE
jgi:hypothetical protein